MMFRELFSLQTLEILVLDLHLLKFTFQLEISQKMRLTKDFNRCWS